MRVLLLAGAVLVFAPSASAAVPRVLAIHFELEVNPVTSSYLDHQLHRAATSVCLNIAEGAGDEAMALDEYADAIANLAGGDRLAGSRPHDLDQYAFVDDESLARHHPHLALERTALFLDAL